MAALKKQVRTSWTTEETTDFLAAVYHQQVTSRSDNKKLRNADICRLVLETMKKKGHKKTLEQIRNKWKVLKKEYYQSCDTGTNKEGGMNPTLCAFYDDLDAILGTRAMANGGEETKVVIESQRTGTRSSIKRDKKSSKLVVDKDDENEEEEDTSIYPPTYLVDTTGDQEVMAEVLGECEATTSSTSADGDVIEVDTKRERLDLEKEKLAIIKEMWAQKKRLVEVTIDVMNLKRQKLELEVQQLKRCALNCPTSLLVPSQTCNNH